MDHSEILNLICQRIREVAEAKGSALVQVSPDTAILGGALSLDSLDLAGIVIELETATGFDPFSEGFINFQTVGQLASLYSGGQ